MSKKIIVLGASELQFPVYKTAKELGIHTIAVDMDEKATAISEAAEFFNISTIDTEAIYALAKEKDIDGILTICSDKPMQVVAEVGRRLGLNTISVDTAFKATNKAAMREALKEKNVPIPLFFVAKNKEEYLTAVKHFKLPFIVKPSDSSGSRGVTLVKDASDLNEVLSARESALKNCTDGVCIVEEYMAGPEISIECFVVEKEVSIIQITDKITTGAPHFVEMGHTQPSSLPKESIEDACNVATSAIKALGIDKGPAHVEIKITENGAKIVELGSRLGGDYITTDLVPLSNGVNMVEASIMQAIGEKPNLEARFSRVSAIRYFSFDRYINISQEMINNLDRMYVNKIEKKEIESSRDRECFYIVSADSFDKLEEKIEIVNKGIM